MKRPITLYYAATILFVLLDFVLGINIRAAFLEPFPSARVAYYLFCYGCLALMLWRPAWTLVIGVAESLAAIIVMTLSMGMRVLVATPEMLDSGRGFVTTEEIVNYIIVGGIAYVGYMHVIKLLKAPKISKNEND
jgi:hypothetical protein